MSGSQAQVTLNAPGKNMLWGGRFTGGLDPLMETFNESIHFDRKLAPEDIRGSEAWAWGNKDRGILTSDELSTIKEGFKIVAREWRNNEFSIKKGDEDIHTANERRLGEIIGTGIAGKLHTGRSRNEQIATDMRLWLRDELSKIETELVEFLKVIVSRAESEISVLMPGYTHLQPAQPVRWSHWLLSHGFSFANDLERLRPIKRRVNRSPLGCGALAGNPFGIDRTAMAKELGFEGLLWNSMSAVGDRDFAEEAMQWSATIMRHISRLAEDLILYSTAEFGFVRLSDAYSTGSSLMPQKKNPDSLELLRGKSGRVFGQMAGLMYSLKGLPSTYNKDLQESVEPLIDCVDTVGKSLAISAGLLSTLTINSKRMLEALSPDMLATDLADYLVRKGVPFRETHHISGKVVALAEKEGLRMDKLSFQQLRGIDSRFEEDVKTCFDYERSVEMRYAKGGTSKSSVLEQIEVLKDLLEDGPSTLDAWGREKDGDEDRS